MAKLKPSRFVIKYSRKMIIGIQFLLNVNTEAEGAVSVVFVFSRFVRYLNEIQL